MKYQNSGDFRIDPSVLPLLLSQDEGPTLEFKSKWYDLKGDTEASSRQKDELVRDILALANGNAESAGEVAYLVIGAADQRDPQGERQVFHQAGQVPAATQILQIVRSAAHPPLSSLGVIPFKVAEARLFALALPPSPHVFETTRNLRTPGQEYTEHIVFIRRGSEIGIANSRERDTIRRMKEVRLAEARNPPAMLFGGAVGATIAGMLLARISRRMTGSSQGAIAGGAFGIVFGGLFGALIGSSYDVVLRTTQTSRNHAIPTSALIMVSTWLASGRIADRLVPKKRP